jgi:FAD/FMN-containing dehydrogenase
LRKTRITRRECIKRSAGVGAALALAIVRPRSSFGAVGEVDPAAIKKFATSLNGRLILPGDQAYETARRIFNWNPTTQKRPAMIVQCAGAEDVTRSVEFVRQHDLPLAVRGGGHSPLGWGICEGGVVVDVSPIKDVSVDSVKRTVRAGAGLLTAELLSAVCRHNLAPILGQCPMVGISGLTLGGGLSWLSGKYGATCDNLLSAQMVASNGHSILVSAEHNPDLFWAIRGGGGNFGIATSFEYRLHPVSEVLAGGIQYRFSEARDVLRFFRDFMATAPDELQAVAFTPGFGDRSVNVAVCYTGDLKEGEKVVRPLRKMARPVRDTVQQRPYAETSVMPLYGEFNPKPFHAAKNCYIERLSDGAIEVFVDQFARAPYPGSRIGLHHYMHGAVCRVEPDTTAFELRAPGGLHVEVNTGWEDPAATDASMAWANDTWKALQPFSGGRIYANYMSVDGERAVKAAFGGNYPRLVAIKNKYDPTNFFRLNQNIRPAAL